MPAALRRTLPLIVILSILGFLGRGEAPSTALGAYLLAPSSSSLQLFVQPGAHLSPVLSLIREAKHSVRLEIYLLTERSIITELGRARQRGVEVRVLLEQRPYGDSAGALLGYRLLQEAKVPVHWANESAFTFTHEKAMTVDGVVAGIFTFNLTSSGIFRNREFGVIDSDTTDARALQDVFDADWNHKTVRVSDPRLVVSPYNSRRDFQTLIDGARSTLDLYAEEVDDASIESHLIAARQRGVRVRLITSADSPGVETLRGSGVAVTLMVQPYVHAKAIVADRRKLFVGSENISSTSLDKNREVGILDDHPGPATMVEQTFAADWRGNTESNASPTTGGGSLRVQVSVSPPTVRRGELLTVTATTTAGATCSVKLTYPDRYVSRARALSGSEVAGTTGRVSWSLHEGSKATGTAWAEVTCSMRGRSAAGTTTFEIR